MKESLRSVFSIKIDHSTQSFDPEALEGRFSKEGSRRVEFLKYSIFNLNYSIDWGRKQKLVPPFFCRLNLKPELIVATTGGMQQDPGPPLGKKIAQPLQKFSTNEI